MAEPKPAEQYIALDDAATLDAIELHIREAQRHLDEIMALIQSMRAGRKPPTWTEGEAAFMAARFQEIDAARSAEAPDAFAFWDNPQDAIFDTLGEEE